MPNFLGRPYGDALPDEVIDKIRAALVGIARDGLRREFEYSLDVPAGARQFSASMSQLSEGSGQPGG